jgi:hypothetical protein
MDEFLINTTTAGDQDQPGVAGLSGTQFAAVWADRQSGNIKGQMFGVNGAKTSGEFVVNFPGAVGTKRTLPAVVETDTGLVVAWIEQAPSAVAQLKLRTFDADSMSGPESQVSSAEVEPLMRPALARLAGGGSIVVWADKRANERIRAQRFSIDGEKQGAEFRANTVPGLHRVPMVASLTNGNIVIGWRARLPGPLLAHLQIFNAKGPVGTEITTALDITDAALAALDTGRFVISHIRSALDGETGFDTVIPQSSLFEAAGTSANIKIAATSATKVQTSWPALAPLSGGRFLLAWTQSATANPAAAGTNVMARIFSAKGAIGNAVQVNTLTGGNRFSLAAAASTGPAGDTAFFAWAEDSAKGADKAGRAIEGRVLPIPAAGF